MSLNELYKDRNLNHFPTCYFDQIVYNSLTGATGSSENFNNVNVSGILQLYTGATAEIRCSSGMYLYDRTSTNNTINIKCPTGLTSSFGITLPTNPSTTGMYLTSNTGGDMSWHSFGNKEIFYPCQATTGLSLATGLQWPGLVVSSTGALARDNVNLGSFSVPYYLNNVNDVLAVCIPQFATTGAVILTTASWGGLTENATSGATGAITLLPFNANTIQRFSIKSGSLLNDITPGDFFSVNMNMTSEFNSIRVLGITLDVS